MAATMTAQTGLDAEVAAVARAAAHPFVRRGETVVQLPVADLLGTGTRKDDAGLYAVAMPDRRRVECVAAEPGRPEVGEALAALAAAGWEVVVLVPAAHTGTAHRVLRGLAMTLQAWWGDPEAGICFGAEERP